MKIKTFLPANLKFLREGVGLTIQELSDIVNVDPIDIYRYETEQTSYVQTSLEKMDDLVKVCHYFLVYLEDMILTDLQIEVFDKKMFYALKDELLREAEIDRRTYSKRLLEAFKEDNSETEETEEERIRVAKTLLMQIQKTYRITQQYYHLRAKGLIPKNGFFEEG